MRSAPGNRAPVGRDCSTSSAGLNKAPFFTSSAAGTNSAGFAAHGDVQPLETAPPGRRRGDVGPCAGGDPRRLPVFPRIARQAVHVPGEEGGGCSAQASSIWNWRSKRCSTTPKGLLKKLARNRNRPVSPRRRANSTNRTRSKTKGAASIESQPCQMNCIVIGVPRKPVKWMWSQAVFQSPRLSMYSIETSVCGLVAEDFAEDVVLAGDFRLLVGRIVEHAAVHVAEDVVADPTHHLQISPGEHRGQNALEQRLAGLAVAAGVAVPRSRANSSIAAGAAPSEGVKLMYEQPKSKAAIA